MGAHTNCKCGAYLFTDTERQYGLCNRCADDEADRERERREFEYWHRDNPEPRP